jgi:hypothetical protein
MKERPILFSSEMVRAILDGRKTQTRRVIKPQPPINCQVWSGWIIDSTAEKEIGSASWTDVPGVLFNKEHIVKCPFGKMGDLLWVRETWRIVGWHEGEPYLLGYKADGAQLEEPGDSSDYDDYKYAQYSIDSSEDCDKAKIPIDEYGIYQFQDDDKFPTRWRPSIFMPRWASRITLEITGVRVERLQDITYEDAVAEGTPGVGLVGANILMLVTGTNNLDDAEKKARLDSFAELWDGINVKNGYPWFSNPWVWVIQFKKIGEVAR